jgi:hypothetical protein
LLRIIFLKVIFWGSVTSCASPPPRPSIFSDYSCFGSTTLLTGMTGNSLHMQWPQSHGSYLDKFVIKFSPNSEITFNLVLLFRWACVTELRMDLSFLLQQKFFHLRRQDHRNLRS